MADQLATLLHTAALPNVTLRVIPAHLGAHPGSTGRFTLLEVRDFKPIVYLETETSSNFLETSTEIEAYRRILTSLEDIALDEEHSREQISNLALTLGEKS